MVCRVNPAGIATRVRHDVKRIVVRFPVAATHTGRINLTTDRLRMN